MQKTPLSLTKSASADPLVITSFSTADLASYADGWLLDGEIRQHSAQTRGFRRMMLDKLLWFLREKEYALCGKAELRAFLAYLSTGHTAEGGRWGNTQLTQAVRPSTAKTYFSHLRTFFAGLLLRALYGVANGYAGRSHCPTRSNPAVHRKAGRVPAVCLPGAQVIRSVTRRLSCFCWIRASALPSCAACGFWTLTRRGRTGTVLGKGNKRRSVYLGARRQRPCGTTYGRTRGRRMRRLPVRPGNAGRGGADPKRPGADDRATGNGGRDRECPVQPAYIPPYVCCELPAGRGERVFPDAASRAYEPADDFPVCVAGSGRPCRPAPAVQPARCDAEEVGNNGERLRCSRGFIPETDFQL